MVTSELYHEINNVLTEHGNIGEIRVSKGVNNWVNNFESPVIDHNSSVSINICDENNDVVARLDNHGLHENRFMNSAGERAEPEGYTLTTTGNAGDAFTVYPYGNSDPYESRDGSRVIWNQDDHTIPNDELTNIPEEARAPTHIDIKVEDNSFIRLDMSGGIYVNGKLVMTSTKILRAIEKILIDKGFLDNYTVKEEGTKDEDAPVRLKTLIENLRRKGVSSNGRAEKNNA